MIEVTRNKENVVVGVRTEKELIDNSKLIGLTFSDEQLQEIINKVRTEKLLIDTSLRVDKFE